MDTPHHSMLIHWSDEDQSYLITLPEWRERVLGPVTHGSTYEEAVAHGKDALEVLIASTRKYNGPLPPLPPSTLLHQAN